MLWCQDCTLLSQTSEIYAALGIFNCGPQFPWLKIARVFLCIRSCSPATYLVAVMLQSPAGSLVALLPSRDHYLLLPWSDGMVRSVPNTMQAAVSVSMLLEGVHFSCFQLLYPHTQVFFKGFKSFTRERTIGHEESNYLEKWELIGTPATSHLPTTSDLVSVLWNPSNYLSLSIYVFLNIIYGRPYCFCIF